MQAQAYSHAQDPLWYAAEQQPRPSVEEMAATYRPDWMKYTEAKATTQQGHVYCNPFPEQALFPADIRLAEMPTTSCMAAVSRQQREDSYRASQAQTERERPHSAAHTNEDRRIDPYQQREHHVHQQHNSSRHQQHQHQPRRAQTHKHREREHRQHPEHWEFRDNHSKQPFNCYDPYMNPTAMLGNPNWVEDLHVTAKDVMSGKREALPQQVQKYMHNCEISAYDRLYERRHMPLTYHEKGTVPRKPAFEYVKDQLTPAQFADTNGVAMYIPRDYVTKHYRSSGRVVGPKEAFF